MNLNIRIAIITLFVVTITTLIVERIVMNDLKMSQFINHMGFMRYLGNSILLDTRSLHLASQGYATAYTEDDYRKSLKTSIDTLDNFIISLSDEISGYSYIHNVFIETDILILEKGSDGSVYASKKNLFQALQRLILESNSIINTSLLDFSTLNQRLFYVYQNFPTNTLKGLNDSVHLIVRDIKQHTWDVFDILQWFKTAFFVPPIIMIILSIPSIITLEKINKENWTSLSHLDIVRQQYLRDKLHDRLFELHGIEVDEVDPRPPKKGNYSSIWKILAVKIFLLEIISIVYYLSAMYGFQTELNSILISQSEFTYYGGLRRMLSPNSYFWAREIFLEKLNISFVENLDNSYNFPSLTLKLDTVVDEYQLIDNELNYGSLTKYCDDNLINLSVGNPCDLMASLSIDCKTSYISMGIKPAIKNYLEELRGVKQYEIDDWEDILRLEKYSKLIGNSAISLMQTYINATDTKIENYMTNMMITTLAYFFCLVIVSILLVFTAVNNIKQELVGKIDILKYF